MWLTVRSILRVTSAGRGCRAATVAPRARAFSACCQSEQRPRLVNVAKSRPYERSRRGLATLSSDEVRATLPSMEELGLREGDHVTVAMSGGVDSSTTLRILSEFPLGIDVIFMRNWDPLLSEASTTSSGTTEPGYALSYSSSSKGKGTDSPCSWEKDWNDVRRISRFLGIEDHKVRMVDLSKEYWSRVFEPSIGVWERGGTPNPDVDCNREIKFGALLDHLPNKPRHFVATGHYGRVQHPLVNGLDPASKSGGSRLFRAKDRTKDQTYYLSQMNEAQLSRTILPLGRITKSTVRQLAAYWNLPNHSKEESMGVCFIGERGKFGDFISQYTSPPETPGHLVLPSGERVGMHKGLWYYTIGQRAKVANQLKPLFVAKKGVGEEGQDILVVPGSDHPLLLCSKVYTDKFHWIHGQFPHQLLAESRAHGTPSGTGAGTAGAGGESKVNIQVRHRMEPVPGVVRPSNRVEGGVDITFESPLKGVSPGQVAAVWYGDWCLGSGVIRDTQGVEG